jgi:hypothetical protein
MSNLVDKDSSRGLHKHIVALAVVVFLGAVGLIGVQRTVGDTIVVEQPRAVKKVYPQEDGASVTQTFPLKYHHLSAIEVKLATVANPVPGSLIFRMHVSDQELITQTVALESVENNAYYSFEFDPVLDFEEEEAQFRLQLFDIDKDNTIAIWGTTEDIYQEGMASWEGFETSGVQDLTFRLYYRPSSSEKVGILAQRLVSNKPAFFGDVRFYILMGTIYLMLIYLLILGLLSLHE